MRQIIPCVETHTCGEPTRFISVLNLPGDSIAKKQEYCRSTLDHVRRALVLEPRGHRHMFGGIMTTPINAGSACGVIWMDSAGYLSGCGHATIALGAALVETGMVPIVEPVTRFCIDVPSGQLELSVHIENGHPQEITFRNVPAFSVASDVTIDVPDVGTIRADIAFGGNFFAIVDAASLGLEIRPDTTAKLVELGLKIREATNLQHTVSHPTLPQLNRIELVTFRGPPTVPGARYLNTHVFGSGSMDRSPGGTGTSAVMAALLAKGELDLNQEVIAEGVAGGLFRGRLTDFIDIGGTQAVVPEITGTAHITGFHQFLLDTLDPLNEGFVLA